MELWKFMMDNLAFAFYGNTSNEYSEEEYNLAKRSLKPYLSIIQDLDEKLLIQSFACVIRHIKYVKNYYDKTWTNKTMKEKGASWNQYHKMIFEFNRAMHSMTYGFEGELENCGKTFPIKKIIFRGAKKKQSIELEGHILEILRGIFFSFNSVYSKKNEQMMKDFSFDFYEAYQEFMMQWQILNAEQGTIAKGVIQAREESSIETAFNRYRNRTAFFIHSFIKKYEKSIAKIPEWHKKFIGELFISCSIAHNEDENTLGYVGTSYNAVRRWIEEGEKTVK